MLVLEFLKTNQESGRDTTLVFPPPSVRHLYHNMRLHENHGKHFRRWPSSSWGRGKPGSFPKYFRGFGVSQKPLFTNLSCSNHLHLTTKSRKPKRSEIIKLTPIKRIHHGALQHQTSHQTNSPISTTKQFAKQNAPSETGSPAIVVKQRITPPNKIYTASSTHQTANQPSLHS